MKGIVGKSRPIHWSPLADQRRSDYSSLFSDSSWAPFRLMGNFRFLPRLSSFLFQELRMPRCESKLIVVNGTHPGRYRTLWKALAPTVFDPVL